MYKTKLSKPDELYHLAVRVLSRLVSINLYLLRNLPLSGSRDCWKVCDGVAKIKLNKAKKLKLANLEARRDW